MLGIIGGISAGVGLLGALSSKSPKYNSKSLKVVLDLIDKQEQNINQFFEEANKSYESQFANYYTTTMGQTANQLANLGIYESPVSENKLNRIRTTLAETYMAGKSELAGQKLSALSSIDQQRINYYQALSNAQYQNQLSKYQKSQSIFGAIGGIGGSLLRI